MVENVRLTNSARIVGGYYDSGSVRSASRLHNYLVSHAGQSKLTLGPWSHGARSCFTPSSEFTGSAFPLFDEVKRFFDCELKGVGCEQGSDKHSVRGAEAAAAAVGIRSEPAVHYFISGAKAEWGTVEGHNAAFPGASVAKAWSNFQLTPAESKPVVHYTVDNRATSGVVSRWNLVHHLMKKPVIYDERKEQMRRTTMRASICS